MPITLLAAALVAGGAAADERYFVLAVTVAVAACVPWVSSEALILSWVLITALVPSWWSVSAGGLTLPPASFIGIPVVIILVFRQKLPRPSHLDYLFFVAIFLSVAGATLTGAPPYVSYYLIVLWVPAFVVGRMAHSYLPTAIALAGLAAAAWAVIEFVFGIHIFAGQISESSWAIVQTRGDLARSEGAFGHALALGGFLLLALPFVRQYARRGVLTALSMTIMFAGIVATLSRGPVIGLIIFLIILALSGPGPKALKWLYITLASVGVWAAYNLLDSSTLLGQELSGSNDYRFGQLVSTLSTVRLVGIAEGSEFTRSYGLRFSGIQWIDNFVLFQALQFGAVCTLLLVYIYVRQMNGWTDGPRLRERPAQLAMLSVLPVLLTVSAITQFQVFVLLVLGMSVASWSSKLPDAGIASAYQVSRRWRPRQPAGMGE